MSDYPDFNISALLKGFYAGEPKALTLDVNGYMIAMLNAMYAGSPLELECDANGNMNMNIKAQELEEVLNRAKFGTAWYDEDTTVCAASDTTELLEVLGKGYFYGILVYTTDVDVLTADRVSVFLDDHEALTYSWEEMNNYSIQNVGMYMPTLVNYDPVSPVMSANFACGYTFETKLEVFYTHGAGNSVSVTHKATFAAI